MFPDFKELLASFNAHNVKYLIVGGYAVSFHAQPRATKDLDLWHLEDPRKFIRFGREPIAVEILPSIDGVDFDEAWARRVDAVIDPEHGLRAFFISRTDLALLTSSFREGESDCKGRRWAVTHAIKQVLRLRFAPLRMTNLFSSSGRQICLAAHDDKFV